MDKTIQTHIDRVKSGKFTKSEIGAFTKMITSARFATEERKESIRAMIDQTLSSYDDVYVPSRAEGRPGFHAEAMHFAKPAKITLDQTKLGKEYLKRRYIKNNGEARLCVDRELTKEQFEIVKNVSRFEFVGVLIVQNPFSGSTDEVLPIYRTYDRKGNYFDYAPIHWGVPVIMEGVTKNLSKVA